MANRRFFPIECEILPYAERSTISGELGELHIDVNVIGGAGPIFHADQWADLFRELANSISPPETEAPKSTGGA